MLYDSPTNLQNGKQLIYSNTGATATDGLAGVYFLLHDQSTTSRLSVPSDKEVLSQRHTIEAI